MNAPHQRHQNSNAPLTLVRPRPQELRIRFGELNAEGQLAPETEALVNEHREVDCKSYDACLQVACNNKWGNFTCTACPMRQVRTVSPGPSVYDR